MKKYLMLVLSIAVLAFSVRADSLQYNEILVQQTDYNCVPASIEMIYRLYDEYEISQHDIRKSIGYDGVVYTYDIEDYLKDNFYYEEKKVCCMDRLINSFGEYPILLIIDQQKLSWRDYNGHAIVGVGNVRLDEDGMNRYIDVLDPDYGVETYNLIRLYDAITSYHDSIYIIKGIKQK